MKKQILLLLITNIVLLSLCAQENSTYQYNILNFNRYMELVSSNNLEYAAEKYNVDIAEAAVESARVFNDPSISFSYTDDREGTNRTAYGYSSGLGMTLELFGKRSARIDLAKSESDLQKAFLLDYFRRLRADATLTYLEALKQHMLYQVSSDSYNTMKQLAEADSIRYRLGIIMEIDADQSKLEAGILKNELMHSRAQFDNAIVKLNLMTGKQIKDTLFFPEGKMEIENRDFIMAELTSTALNNRSDMLVALNSIDVSEKYLNLSRKERKFDMDINLEMGNNYIIYPGSPKVTTFAAGLGIPLKFSNIYKGELRSARFQILQAEAISKQVELSIQTEIMQAWQMYIAFCRQVDNFKNGLLQNAASVKNGKIYSYKRGETSLLEVLNAQRTYDEIQTAYYEALFNKASSLIELEKASGIWDITF